MPEPLTPEEEAALRERHRQCSRPMAWHIDVHRLLATLAARTRPSEAGLREALVPLATRMADHLLHPEEHAPDPTAAVGGDGCWTDLYRAIVGLDLAAATPPEEPSLDVKRLARAIAATKTDGQVVETTEGPVDVIDYPDEWYDTPQSMAEQIAAEYARLREATR
jgi:hypothetical protein